MMQTRSRTRSALAKEDADKLAKNNSASTSQSDYQKIDDTVTRSKAPVMEPKLEIPEQLYWTIDQSLMTQHELERCTSNNTELLARLEEINLLINHFSMVYKKAGHLPSDWEYNRDTLRSCVPIHIDPGSIHFSSAPVKAAHLNSKKLDKEIKKADKIARQRSAASSQGDYQKIHRVTPSKDTRIIQTRSRTASAREPCQAFIQADKLAKNHSASTSQSDYQKIDDTVTRSKAPVMEPNMLEIPDDLHLCIQEILKTEQKLKKCSSDEGLLKHLKYYKENIGGLIEFHKENGHLQSDWEYDHDIASSYVPKSFLFSAEKKPKKNIPRNPHICNDPLVGGEPKAARRNFKKIDEKFQADKLTKNHSASCQSDYQRATPSKEAPQLEIPENLHFWIRKALEAERELERCTSNEGLLRKLNHIEENIALATRFCKETGRLQSDWEYDPDIASSYFAKQKPKTNNPYLDIPKTVYYYVERANKAEQELKTRPCDEALLQQLSFHTKQIGAAAEFFIAGGQLPSDWKYNPDDASSYVPIEVPPLPPAEKEIKMDIPRNPHIDSAPLKDKRDKTVWRNFKKLDKTFKTTTRLGLPFPTDEEIFTRLAADDKFVTFICDFAVRVFNDSCQMYRNNNSNSKRIIDPKVQECKYIKVRPCYLFYMTIEAREQGKLGAYEINLRCNLDDGAIVLDSFCIQGPKAWGTREGAFITLDAIYETVKDDSLDDPEVYYYKSGMVRRTGGYDFYNPSGWNRLWEWDDVNDLGDISDDEWVY